jgi:hypothetical protein
MKLTTSIEVNEIETEVCVTFIKVDGEIQITNITDTHTGESYNEETYGTDSLYSECFECFCDNSADQKRGKLNYNALIQRGKDLLVSGNGCIENSKKLLK